MRKYLVSASVVAATLATAVPAAAQWQPQGNAYGYDNRGQGRRLEVRIAQLRREIVRLDRRGVISDREARRLDAQARELELRFRQFSYNGIDPRERFELQQRIERLEQNIRRQATDGNRRGNDRYDSNGYDRDRDGRDDRYEDDRGRYPG